MDVDAELAAYLGSPDFSFSDVEEPTNAVDNFWENARIDAAAGEPVADGLETRKTAAQLITPDDLHRLEKKFTGSIHSGKRAHRVEKSANGHWVLEYDESNNLIRGYQIEEFEEELTK